MKEAPFVKTAGRDRKRRRKLLGEGSAFLENYKRRKKRARSRAASAERSEAANFAQAKLKCMYILHYSLSHAEDDRTRPGALFSRAFFLSYLMLPSTIPLMMYFCAKIKRMITGSMASKVDVKIKSHCLT